MYSDLIGKPFLSGGRGPGEYDCWGLAVEVFRRYGIDIPDYDVTYEAEDKKAVNDKIEHHRERGYWRRVERPVSAPTLIVLHFNSPVWANHVGVFVGNGMFIHTRQRIGAAVERIDAPQWRHRIEGFYEPGG